VVRRRGPDAIARAEGTKVTERIGGASPHSGALKGPRRERDHRCGQDEARPGNAVRSAVAGR
jgi:hypothetical protein